MASDLGVVGSASVELTFSLEELTASLPAARQKVQAAVDSLATVRSANGNSPFASLVDGADTAAAALGRIDEAARVSVASLQAVEKAAAAAASAARQIGETSGFASSAERSGQAAAALGRSAGEAEGRIAGLVREAGSLATAASQAADGETLAGRATRDWAAAAVEATGRTNELARARLALLTTTLREEQAEAQPTAALRASSTPVQGVVAPASEPPRAAPGPVADHPLATTTTAVLGTEAAVRGAEREAQAFAATRGEADRFRAALAPIGAAEAETGAAAARAGEIFDAYAAKLRGGALTAREVATETAAMQRQLAAIRGELERGVAARPAPPPVVRAATRETTIGSTGVLAEAGTLARADGELAAANQRLATSQAQVTRETLATATAQGEAATLGQAQATAATTPVRAAVPVREEPAPSALRFEQAGRAADELALLGQAGIKAESVLASLRRTFALDDEQMARLAQRFEATRAAAESGSRGIGASASLIDRLPLALEKAATSYEAIQQSLLGVKASVAATSDAMAKVDDLFAAYGAAAREAGTDAQRLAVLQEQLRRALAATRDELAANAAAERQADAGSAASAATGRLARAQEVRGIPVAAPAEPSASGAAPVGIATGAIDAQALALQKSQTRAETFTRTLQALAASEDETDAALVRATAVFDTFDQAVLRSGGNVATIRTELQELQRGLGQIRGDLAAVATAEREDATAAATMATAQERVQATLAQSAAQSAQFQRSLAGIGAGQKETATATSQAAAAFDRYDAAVRAAGGNTAALRIAMAQLRQDLGGIKAGLEEAAGAAERTGGAFATAGKLVDEFFFFFRISVLFQVIGVLQQIPGAVLGTVSAFQNVRTQLDNVTGSAAAGEAAYEGLKRSALATGSSLQASIDAFTRITLSSKQYGLTVNDNVRITDVLNRITASSGATAEEASRAYVQLGQAISKGRAESQDLKDIQQNAPAISQTFEAEAQKQSTTLAQLQATTGVTAKFILQALEDAADGIIGHIGAIPENTDRATERVKTAFFDLAGDLAKSDAFGPLNQSLDRLAQTLEDPAVKTSVQQLGADLKSAFSFLVDNIPRMNDFLNKIAGFLNTAADPKKTFAAITSAITGTAPAAGGEQEQAPASTTKEIQHRLAAPPDEVAPSAASAAVPPGQEIDAALAAALSKQGILQGRIAAQLRVGNDGFAKSLNDQELGLEREIEELKAKQAQAVDDAKRPVPGTPSDVASVPAQPATAPAGAQPFSPIKDVVTAADTRDAEALRKKFDLEGEYAEQVAKVNALKDKGAITDKEATLALAGLNAQEQHRLEALQKQKEVAALVAKGYTESRAQATVNEGHQPFAGQDPAQKLKEQIAGQKDLLEVAPKADRAQIEQTILNLRKELVKVEQQRSDQLATQRDAILEQGTADQKLQAMEDKIARASRPAAGQRQAALATPALRETAQRDAGEKYAKAVEAEAVASDKGADPLTQAQAKLDALGKAQANVAALVKGEAAQRAVAAGIQKEQVDLQTQIGTLQAKSDEKLGGQETANEKVLASLRKQGAEVKAGFQDAGEAIQAAGEQAADSIKLPSVEEQGTQAGREQAVRAGAEQELARAQAESNERLKLRTQVLQQVEGADDKYARKVAELNSDLAAGVITTEEYARAVTGVVTPEQEFAEATAKVKLQLLVVEGQYQQGNTTLARRNQLLLALQAQTGRTAAAERQAKIGQLYDRGEPGSGVDEGTAALGGLQAGGLEIIGQYGNVAKAAGATITGAFEQSTDALANFITTGKGGLPELAQSLEQLIVKMTIQLLLARAIDAAIGAFSGGGGAGAGAGAANFQTTGSTGAAYGAHGLAFEGGGIVKMAKGGLFDGPTLIPLRHGAAVAGEAGPEAAVPLVRTADGNLGVRTESGGGGGIHQTINVNDQRGSGAPVEVQRSSDGRQLDVFIRDAVAGQFGRGEHDRTMKSRFGVSPQAQR